MGDKDDTWDMLGYFQNASKEPLVKEQLKTSIESNVANTGLSRETLKHFKKSRTDNRIALYSTLLVSLITCTILTVQTVSVQKTEITQPIKLESQEVQQLLQETASNNLLLSRQLDSLKLELRKLTKTINSTYSNN